MLQRSAKKSIEYDSRRSCAYASGSSDELSSNGKLGGILILQEELGRVGACFFLAQ